MPIPVSATKENTLPRVGYFLWTAATPPVSAAATKEPLRPEGKVFTISASYNTLE